MLKRKSFRFFLFISLICLPQLTIAPNTIQAAETSPLLLFFSGNVNGETEACG